MKLVNLLERYPAGTGQRPIQERLEAIRKGIVSKEVAKRFGREYFDGTRLEGYGGYHYDGRWKPVAHHMVEYYGLTKGHRILDVGSGKGFLLHDWRELLPGIRLMGLELSSYAIEHSMEDVRPFLVRGNAKALPFEDGSFDLVLSINVIHSMLEPDARSAIAEMERVSRGYKYIQVNSFRNEVEKRNLIDWGLTEELILSPEEWEEMFEEVGYSGEYYWTLTT